jgi:uncharacterized protein YkwD
MGYWILGLAVRFRVIHRADGSGQSFIINPGVAFDVGTVSIRMVERIRKALSLILLMAAVGVTLGAAQTSIVRQENIEKKIFRLVNEAREANGLPPFKWNAKLGDAAAAHLSWMIARKNLSHRFPGEDSVTQRIAATGLRFNASAENVAFATDWEDIHPGLLRSPGHRANIMSTKYDEIGIAVALGPNGYYAVQNFAHTTSESDSGDAEARLARSLRRGLRGDVEIKFSASVRKAVCDMAERDQLQATKLPAEPSLRRMFAYTTSEPEDVPEKLLSAASASGSRRIVTGVCYKATDKYPGGTYWVGVLY